MVSLLGGRAPAVHKLVFGEGIRERGGLYIVAGLVKALALYQGACVTAHKRPFYCAAYNLDLRESFLSLFFAIL